MLEMRSRNYSLWFNPQPISSWSFLLFLALISFAEGLSNRVSCTSWSMMSEFPPAMTWWNAKQLAANLVELASCSSRCRGGKAMETWQLISRGHRPATPSVMRQSGDSKMNLVLSTSTAQEITKSRAKVANHTGNRFKWCKIRRRLWVIRQHVSWGRAAPHTGEASPTFFLFSHDTVYV